jgi:uncharacterized protein YqjF (DUF2071 family)
VSSAATAALEAVARQAGTLQHAGHRPWPLPEGPWLQGQTWDDLAFLHWRVDPDELRRLLPGSVELDLHEGEAWLGVTPFLLTHLRLRGLPPLPGVSTFPELNVRTYVTRDGKPGIWFFSLDAANVVAVEGAKRLFRLPYERARMTCVRDGDRVRFESARPGGSFSGSYRGLGDLFHAEPGSLEAFLVERYCLYTEDGGRAYRADIHHAPWPLQRGEARVDLNTVAPVPLPDEEPHVLFTPRQDVLVWPLAELD